MNHEEFSLVQRSSHKPLTAVQISARIHALQVLNSYHTMRLIEEGKILKIEFL